MRLLRRVAVEVAGKVGQGRAFGVLLLPALPALLADAYGLLPRTVGYAVTPWVPPDLIYLLRACLRNVRAMMTRQVVGVVNGATLRNKAKAVLEVVSSGGRWWRGHAGVGPGAVQHLLRDIRAESLGASRS